MLASSPAIVRPAQESSEDLVKIVFPVDVHHSFLFSFLTLRFGETKGLRIAYQTTAELFLQLLDSEENGFKPHIQTGKEKIFPLDVTRNPRYPERRIWEGEIYLWLELIVDEEASTVFDEIYALGKYRDRASVFLHALRLLHFFNEQHARGSVIRYLEAKYSRTAKYELCHNKSPWLFPAVN